VSSFPGRRPRKALDEPRRLSPSDAEIIALAIEDAQHLSKPLNSKFQAPWLLTDFTLNRWETTNRGREEFVNGKWRNTISIDWEQRLPDGNLLTDPKYRKLLELNKTLTAHIRSGFFGKASTPVTWRREVRMTVNLTRWVVLNESLYQPEKYGLLLLDQNALNSLLEQIANGGWTSALQIPERLFRVLYSKAFDKKIPKNEAISLYALPENVSLGFQHWLDKNHCYKKQAEGPHKGKRSLNRKRLVQLLGESEESLGNSWKLSAFLRQFEPDYLSNGLLVSVSQATEFPGHRIKSIDETIQRGSSENSFFTISSYLAKLFSTHPNFPNDIPSLRQVSVLEAQNNAIHLTKCGGHTKFIPINTGLAYLRKAINLVHVYGESIIDCYLAVIREKRRCPELDHSEILHSLEALTGKSFTIETPEGTKALLAVLGVSKFQRIAERIDFELLSINPTLFEIMRVLVGACVVCIGILKPSREYELTHLKRDCLRRDLGGYQMHFELGKSNQGEAYLDLDRPIPFISAKAIQLLQILGAALAEYFSDDTKASENLFYLPKADHTGPLLASETLINDCLDLFCDYVGLPPDELGRRWYVRVHEMRKWFLLLLFWSGKYDVLDAARWIAGHTDAEHIYEYIQAEFPGEELPRLEAEYAVERLRVLESRLSTEGTADGGIGALYQKVLDQFGVNSLSMVEESDWVDYVSLLREQEAFVLMPHSVFSTVAGLKTTGIEVSFIMRET
jgi:hypothetical protein